MRGQRQGSADLIASFPDSPARSSGCSPAAPALPTLVAAGALPAGLPSRPCAPSWVSWPRLPFVCSERSGSSPPAHPFASDLFLQFCAGVLRPIALSTQRHLGEDSQPLVILALCLRPPVLVLLDSATCPHSWPFLPSLPCPCQYCSFPSSSSQCF